MARPQGPMLHPGMKALAAQFAKERISDDYCLSMSAHGDALSHPQKQFIYLAPVTPVDISSSHIRELIREGHSIRKWVAPSVAAYIEEKGLYR